MPSIARLGLPGLGLVAFLTGVLTPLAQQAPAARWPGRVEPGATLLPNGWTIAPAGRHVHIGDLPLAQVQSPDGRFLIVSNNGWSRPTLTVFDLERGYVAGKVPMDHAWLGLAWHPDGRRLFSSAAAHNSVMELRWADQRLTRGASMAISDPWKPGMLNKPETLGFVGGVAIDPAGSMVYAVQVLGKTVSALNVTTRQLKKTVKLSAEPYAPLVSPDGRTLYVSLWGGARVLAFDAQTLEPGGEVPTGEHPNAMLFSKDGSRLFVACANTNAVWVIDVAARKATERISVALYPEAPAGSTPNALALSPDGNTLLVANADNNTVAVVDIETAGASRVEGFIPTGWYPTSVAFDRDGSRIFILSGKGLTSAANPRGPVPGDAGMQGQYVGSMMQGALTILPTPDAGALKQLTATVYRVTPYSDETKLAPANAPRDSPVPRRVGSPSPIKYVFYVIRENRTYDQVLGDLERGNGDPSLTIFGEDVTPNAHAVAREFTVFDNFYVDAEVSYDGHAFSTAAYATDVVEKLWPTNYGGRGGLYLSEGGWEPRNAYGNLSAPAEGYIWDYAKRAGVTYRSYGEFTEWEVPGVRAKARVSGLIGYIHPTYPPYDLEIPDNKRVDVWLEEFREFERTGQLPRLSIIRLGNDHTAGTRPGMPTPRAMVAENDVSLGRIVEAVSNSRFWKESAIFVLEDDAQNGPDHVDAHRSVLLVASPFSKRRAVDSTLYTTSAVLRTIELILGLPPMSQYDASATPIYAGFQPVPDPTPFRLRPARISLTEKNDARAPGARASMMMNFEEADLTPEIELNEILWMSVHGPQARMPPPIRAGFIRAIEEEEEGEGRGRSGAKR
jgi:YVTN family beta-propeller protein